MELVSLEVILQGQDMPKAALYRAEKDGQTFGTQTIPVRSDYREENHILIASLSKYTWTTCILRENVGGFQW